jgi:hypothetical protein
MLPVGRTGCFTVDSIDERVVYAWIGEFDSEVDFERYIEQSYTEDGDSIPSQFMRDVGLDWYDDDFQEFEYHSARRSIRIALSGHSYSESFAPLLIQRATELGIESVGAVFLLYELDNPPIPPSQDAPIRYIGSFPYRVS